jgi:hypothetical protein
MECDIKMSSTEVWIVTWSYEPMDCGMSHELELERDLELCIVHEGLSCFVSSSGICSCFQNIRVTKRQVRARARDKCCTELVHRPDCNAAEVIVPSIIHGWTTCGNQTIITIKSNSNERRKKYSSPSPPSSAFCNYSPSARTSYHAFMSSEVHSDADKAPANPPARKETAHLRHWKFSLLWD